jgi:hypothetical protein
MAVIRVKVTKNKYCWAKPSKPEVKIRILENSIFCVSFFPAVNKFLSENRFHETFSVEIYQQNFKNVKCKFINLGYV